MLTRWTLLDLETVGAPDAELWLPTIDPDGRLTDEAKIKADIEKKKAALLAKAGLHPELCRIVCAGLTEHDGTERILVATNKEQEAALLSCVWLSVNRTTPMVGYGLTWFDAGVLVRRSQLLGVKVPSEFYKQGKYRHDWIVELSDYLTLNGMIDLRPEQRKGMGLDYHCRRFGIDVEDAHSGKDVAQLWAEGNIEAIKAHCAADMSRIRQLADWLGVIDLSRVQSQDAVTEEAGAF